jgi:thiamine biosynthesis protein ThiS
VKVQVNGSVKTVPDGSTVSDLIEALGLRRRSVVVERNGHPVERTRYGLLHLDDGDVLEVVRPVPGG